MTFVSISAVSLALESSSPTRTSNRNRSIVLLFKLAKTPFFLTQRKRNHCSSLASGKMTTGALKGSFQDWVTASIISSASVSRFNANFKCSILRYSQKKYPYKYISFKSIKMAIHRPVAHSVQFSTAGAAPLQSFQEQATTSEGHRPQGNQNIDC